MQLNLLSKIFLGAVAVRIAQREHNKIQVQPLTETACAGNWIGFNQIMDRLYAGATYEERCNIWTFIRANPTDWSSKAQPFFG